METLGSLLDKLSIENIRLTKLAERGDADLLDPVRRKLENLKSEINGHLALAIAGEIPIEEPKHKFYQGERPAGDVFNAKVAARLKKFVYAAGGSREEEEAYKGFRGRLPTVDGLR